MGEKWTQSSEFKNYEISDEGGIRNSKTGKILKPNEDSGGNEIVYLYDNGKRYKRKVSRLVAETYLDENVQNSRVSHIDGNKRKNQIDNLKLISKRKKVKVIETGKIYDSISECSKDLGMNMSTVSKCTNYSFYGNRLGLHFEPVEQ